MDLVLPQHIIFERGAIKRLPCFVTGKKALLITSRGMAERGVVDKIKAILEKGVPGMARRGFNCRKGEAGNEDENSPQLTVFSDVEPEPGMETVKKCKLLDGDTIIGLGGGSVLDVAKYVAMELGARKIMIPTTAGTGSEVTYEAVLKIDGKKKGIKDLKLLPDVALVDPELSASMPKRLAAATGIDALAHAIECHESKTSNVMVKFLAEEAYTLIKANLRKAVDGNKDARERMAYASMLAGMAFGNSGTALGHALSYPLSNQGIPHGEAVAIVLPYALDFNGFDPALSREIKAIIKEVGLGSQKITGNAEEMAEVVFEDKRHLDNNPKPVTKSDLVKIFKEILK